MTLIVLAIIGSLTLALCVAVAVVFHDISAAQQVSADEAESRTDMVRR